MNEGGGGGLKEGGGGLSQLRDSFLVGFVSGYFDIDRTSMSLLDSLVTGVSFFLIGIFTSKLVVGTLQILYPGFSSVVTRSVSTSRLLNTAFLT